MAKRMQALGTLSGGTVLDFASELGVRVRFFHKPDCRSSATIRVGSQGEPCSREQRFQMAPGNAGDSARDLDWLGPDSGRITLVLLSDAPHTHADSLRAPN
jgi:hypothetical protein